MTSSSTLEFSKQGLVAIIKLNRPEVYNSVNRELALAFQQCLDACAADASVRAVLITGAGKAFCAGQDLVEVTSGAVQLTDIVDQHYNPIIEKLRQLEKPVVAAVNGVAAGAGASIALACDVVVAAQSASFIQAFSKIGLIPDSGGTYFLPRLVGLQKASALMMLGDKVTAAEAESLGMIYKVFADVTFADEALQLATRLASMPTRGLAYTKMLLNQTFGNTLEEQLRQESHYQTLAGNTSDYKAGVEAFVKKQTPVFKGE
jgi:2-(1,2-epoxy-1,2-dihydrophenyl)acetyl-CoA isomerase